MRIGNQQIKSIEFIKGIILTFMIISFLQIVVSPTIYNELVSYMNLPDTKRKIILDRYLIKLCNHKRSDLDFSDLSICQ